MTMAEDGSHRLFCLVFTRGGVVQIAADCRVVCCGHINHCKRRENGIMVAKSTTYRQLVCRLLL